MVILYPITILFAGLKFLLRKIFKSKNDDKITEEELLSMVEEAQEDGSLDMQERELISSAIEFDDAEVEDIFVPRVNVIAVPIDMPMEKIKALFLEHNFSRMPVYKNTIDSIVGMIHNIDFFTALEKGENSIKKLHHPRYHRDGTYENFDASEKHAAPKSAYGCRCGRIRRNAGHCYP